MFSKGSKLDLISGDFTVGGQRQRYLLIYSKVLATRLKDTALAAN